MLRSFGRQALGRGGLLLGRCKLGHSRRRSIAIAAACRQAHVVKSGCITKHFLHDSALAYDFVQERSRWQERLAEPEQNVSGVVIPLIPSQWKKLLAKLDMQNATGLVEWLNHQEGVILLPPADGSLSNLLKEHFEIDNASAGGKIVLVRIQDDESNTQGLKSACKSMSLLAKSLIKWKEDETYKLWLPEDSPVDVEDAVLSYLLESYSFSRYKTSLVGEKQQGASLSFPNSSSSRKRKETLALARATYLVRDLISTPAMDLTPELLQRCAESLVDGHDDRVEMETIVGKDLLFYNGSIPNGHGCGMIYAVGAAATRPDHEPRLIKISYRPPECNNKSHVAIVGKGVTFDTGGLNLKPGASMLYMKKDMGGAAHALGLLSCLIELEAPLAVDVWIPAVENVLGHASVRPGDVLTSVSGKTTEVANTDAEGRLILGDALELASAPPQPNLIVDFATLTGAARVAMGTQVVPFFTNTPEMAEQLETAAVETRDPMWQLPLWHGYTERITKSSKIADLRNIPSDDGLGGAITAALYLQQFVGKTVDDSQQQIPWIHLDVYGMGKTKGIGEAQGLRSVFRFLWKHYCS